MSRKESEPVIDDENPEWTEKDFARSMRPEDYPPELRNAFRRMRGPQKAPTKQLVSLRLDRDVLAHFRATGPGWQARINETLRKAAGV
jgi:uncharacterized protein (DUF4415 family)